MSWAFVFALALALSATGAWVDWYSDCNQAKDPDLRISGCTTIIERRKRESLEDRSFAYTNRGDAYVRKGEVDRAIADYDKASEKSPVEIPFRYSQGTCCSRLRVRLK